MRKTNRYAWLLALSLPVAAFAQEKVDLSMMQKIREEGLKRSQVMDIAFNLTDKSGNRLTNSAGYMRAANYAKEALTSWGVSNAQLDPWGEFGKGWELETHHGMAQNLDSRNTGFKKWRDIGDPIERFSISGSLSRTTKK